MSLTERATRKTLVLHIGLQKTGTSSIQVMLAGSASYLDAQGFYFPDLPDAEADESRLSRSPFRHNRIAGTYADYPTSFQRLDQENMALFWRELAADPRIPILSAEDFSRQRDYTALGMALAPFDVTVVLYVRRQDLFAESLYNQRNKILLQRGSTDHLGEDFLTSEDLFAFLRREAYIPILNFTRLLARLEAGIRPVKVLVRAFDRATLEGADVCTDFCALFGWDAQAMSRPGHDANSSVSNQVLASVNEVFVRQGPEAAQLKIAQINQSFQAGEDLSGSYKVFPPQIRRTVQRQYADINAELHRRYGVDLTARNDQ
ncbi:hypothetical protein KDD17_13965 [Sulfitobacter albidus]|uniref:Sulfotransferase family protein n=1 Tax=Sulfitobacter albidus TaxID=2829501 RepID=A0A975JDD7_9RHOB|nr:hypothetical protein [Sulfitobacter albidus]QUJ76020.1 hypothetical protein KDD17_13965 [Sulfitobacter albidus]